MKEMTPKVQRKPSAPSSSMAKVIASTTPSPTAIPVPDVRVPDPSVDFGSGDDFGDGWGSGSGDGSGAGGTTAMHSWCIEIQSRLPSGGDPLGVPLETRRFQTP